MKNAALSAILITCSAQALAVDCTPDVPHRSNITCTVDIQSAPKKITAYYETTATGQDNKSSVVLIIKKQGEASGKRTESGQQDKAEASATDTISSPGFYVIQAIGDNQRADSKSIRISIEGPQVVK